MNSASLLTPSHHHHHQPFLPSASWCLRSLSSLNCHFPLHATPFCDISSVITPLRSTLLSSRSYVFDDTSKKGIGVELEMIDGIGNDAEAIDDDDFIEVGLISGTHGVHGELKVTPLTDFPEERFEQPGIRWVGFRRRSRLMGVSQVELTSGQRMQGKKPVWLITFRGVETLEKAAALIGATILVKQQDRPTLEKDDLYIPDLIGMSVQLKALRSKRKVQEKMSGIKKRVLALKQGHILSGLDSGDKFQREALRMQLMGIDFKLFAHAVQDAMGDNERISNLEKSLFPFVRHSVIDWKGLDERLSNSPQILKTDNKIDEETWNLWQKGLELVSKGRVAVASLSAGGQTKNYVDLSSLKLKFQCQAQHLLCMQDLAELISGEKPQIPWVVVSTKESEETIKNLIKNESFFGLDETQVGSAYGSETREVDLVLFGIIEEQGSSIVVKSATWPLEDGPEVFCLRQNFFGTDGKSCNTRILSEPSFGKTEEGWCGKNDISSGRELLMKPKDVEMPFSNIFEDRKGIYKNIPLGNCTFSVEHLKHLSEQRYRLRFNAVQKKVADMDECDGEWEEIVSHESNAVQLHCSMHSALLFCSPSRVSDAAEVSNTPLQE